MIVLLSPAKSLDFEGKASTDAWVYPHFQDDSEVLIKKLRTLSRKKIGELMKISPALAELNHDRYKEWRQPKESDGTKQALFAFRGDVYRGLDVDSYNKKDIDFAQNHLRILSGLHGLLRPLDLIHPYRLEMGTRLPIRKNKNLYEFWGDKITNAINEDMGKSNLLVNLASNEYFKSVKPKLVNGRIINCLFKDFKNGEYKIVMTYAKLARGYLASYIVKNKITKAEDVKGFNVEGYTYNEPLSEENDWVFTRG